MGIRLEYEMTGRLKRMLWSLQNPDFGDFMKIAEIVIREDHVNGILAGTDANGQPMEPAKYRLSLTQAPLKKKQGIKNVRFSTPAQTANDNLTTQEYKKLSGPPLAPRGIESRVIKNFITRSGTTGKEWVAEAGLVNIISRKGVPFMESHFEGRGRLPKRDLRGLRPETVKRIQTLLALEIRRQFFDAT